jgi:hypothetical protein
VISKTQSLHIDRDGEQFQVKVITRNLEKRIKYAFGSIDTSLFSASQQAGLSNQLTMKLASVFGWDIDFALDIRRGDQFSVVYEEMVKKFVMEKFLRLNLSTEGKVIERHITPIQKEIQDFLHPRGIVCARLF